MTSLLLTPQKTWELPLCGLLLLVFSFYLPLLLLPLGWLMLLRAGCAAIGYELIVAENGANGVRNYLVRLSLVYWGFAGGGWLVHGALSGLPALVTLLCAAGCVISLFQLLRK